MNLALQVLAVLALQTTPQGGPVARFVPPNPTPASFISDQRGVLTAGQRAALDKRIADVQGAGLGDIAVAVLPSIGDYSPNQVGVEIYRTWRVGSRAPIGSARRDVGVLLLIVPKELSPNNRGHCWFTTGTGAEGAITDASAAATCRAIIPLLQRRDYNAAIASAITFVENRYRTAAGIGLVPGGAGQRAADAPAPDAPRGVVPAQGRRRSPLSVPFTILGVLVSIVTGVAFTRRWRRNRPRTCPACGQMMHRLSEELDDEQLDKGQRLEERLRSVDYDVWMCSCGHSLVIPYRKMFSKYSECRECRRRTATSHRTVIVPSTTATTGVAEDRFICNNCDARWTERVVLPRITTSSNGGSGGGGGGGGGGHSFGGSGSTSGGGGGASY